MTASNGPIVVGVDESDTARKAAFNAATLAAALGAPLHVVMAVNKSRSQQMSSGDGQFTVDWLSAAEQFLDGLMGELPAKPVTRAVCVADPATALCQEAEKVGARMIIVGNRRVQGISRVLGAIATDVARHAPCDVLIANTTGD